MKTTLKKKWRQPQNKIKKIRWHQKNKNEDNLEKIKKWRQPQKKQKNEDEIKKK